MAENLVLSPQNQVKVSLALTLWFFLCFALVKASRGEVLDALRQGHRAITLIR